MKKFMVIVCATMTFGATVSAQKTTDKVLDEKTDTIVVIVKHKNGENVFERTNKLFKTEYKVINNSNGGDDKSVKNSPISITDSVKINRMYRKHYRADIEL